MGDNSTPIIDIVLPTFRMEPEEDEKFYPSVAKEIARKVIEDELADGRQHSTDFEEDAKFWSMNISDKVREAVYATLTKSRYKIVVQTVIGQKKDQGIRVASRCLWDPSMDNYASVEYTNSMLFCTVLIFALYTD